MLDKLKYTALCVLLAFSILSPAFSQEEGAAEDTAEVAVENEEAAEEAADVSAEEESDDEDIEEEDSTEEDEVTEEGGETVSFGMGGEDFSVEDESGSSDDSVGFSVLEEVDLDEMSDEDLNALLNADNDDFVSGKVIDAKDIDSDISVEMEKGVFFSGSIDSGLDYYMKRDFFKNGSDDFNQNQLAGSLEADLRLTIRLDKGFKTVANLGVGYFPLGRQITKNYYQLNYDITNGLQTNSEQFYESNELIVMFKEFYIDADINKKVYFRAGKQFLKWGRGYFWNPTDLINVEKKSFFDMDSSLEGTYGLYMHIPFGAKFNIYGFVNAENADNLDKLGVAGKVEALLGPVEFSLSAMAKEGLYPTYGLDLSSRIPGIDLDVWGELSLSQGANELKIVEDIISTPITMTNYETAQEKEDFIPKFSLGLGRSFDIADVEDRLMLNMEFYYNHNGHDDEELIEKLMDKGYLGQSILYSTYQPNSFGKVYMAFFGNFQQFINENMTLTLNAMGNLSDKSFVLLGGITYNPIYDFNIGMTLSGYLGEENREYTMAGNGMSVNLNASVDF